MAAITPPTCASDFVFNASWASNCFAAYPCLCHDQTFLTTAETCIQEQCDAADQQLWAQYFAQNCPNVDIFPTLTTTSNSQATAAAGVTSPSAAQPTSVVLVSTSSPTSASSSISSSVSSPVSSPVSSSILTTSNPATPAPSSPNPTLSTSTTSEISSTTSRSPVLSPGSTGLSVGDEAGIAGAVLTGVGS